MPGRDTSTRRGEGTERGKGGSHNLDRAGGGEKERMRDKGTMSMGAKEGQNNEERVENDGTSEGGGVGMGAARFNGPYETHQCRSKQVKVRVHVGEEGVALFLCMCA